LTLYLDASVLVALFTHDPLTARADKALRTTTPKVVVSDFAAAEFSSAIARRVRTGELAAREARAAFAAFDEWTARSAQRAQTGAADIAVAVTLLRRLDLTLRMPDAINIAIVLRLEAELLTFDDKMTACAKALRVKTPAA
jgi:predicted nucleic acid-binding protein